MLNFWFPKEKERTMMPVSKRSASGGGTIRQRPDGRWEGRITLGRDPGTGKQIQKSVYGKTQKEVRQKLTQVTAAVDTGTYQEPSKLTVGAWLDIWLAEYVKNALKPGTRHSYTRICNYYVKPALAAVRLSALNTHTIQKMYNALQGSEEQPGLSAKTIKNIHGVVHRALQQAVTLGYIRFNPADACILPRVIKKEIKPLDETEMTAFLDVIRDHEYERVYFITMFTGMRQSEVLGLQWPCVDFERGTILINQQLLKDYEKGIYYLAPLKNDKARVITPAPSVMAALHTQKNEQIKMRLRAGEAWNKSDYVFTNEIGTHLKHVTIYKNYKRLVDSIGISTARFHDLRHTYAVTSLQSGDDVKTVQENLGHHAAAFTLDVYGHVTEKMKKDSAARMETYIKGIKSRKG